ncbi:hypothetical protein KA005_27825 [bacterium]|nr:hypothetical protein [bacterium]
MIDSEFCIRCGGPYAMYDVWYCDSCIKDMLHEGRKKLMGSFSKTSPNQPLDPDSESNAVLK